MSKPEPGKPEPGKPELSKPEPNKHERNRQRAREIRQAQAQAKRRRKLITLIGGVGGAVIVGLLIAIIVVAVHNSRSSDEGSATGAVTSPSGAVPAGTATPANLTANGAIPIGKADAPVRVELFVDYICPGCGVFEKTNAAEIDRLVKAGTARVELHPMAFLDRASSGTRYSTRAANAVATVAEKAPGSLLAFSTELFKNQPKEGTQGLSDKQIGQLASKVGVPQEVVEQFKDRLYEQWTASASQAAVKSGIEGTPTVKLNGKVFDGDLSTVGPLTQAIEQAAQAAK